MRGLRGISVCLGKSKAYFSEFYYVNSNFLNFQGAGVQTFPFPTLYRSAYMYEYIYFCIHFKPLIKHCTSLGGHMLYNFSSGFIDLLVY